VNPIIKYLESDTSRAVPKDLFEESIAPILKDEDVSHYLNGISQPCLQPHSSSDEFFPTLSNALIAAIALGYMYGSEGSKTPEDIVNAFMKEHNLKTQEGKQS